MALNNDWLLTDAELNEISSAELESNVMELTSPAWSTALKVGLNLLPVGTVFL
ncbi:hypothetical protein SAMN05216416_0739 [Streptococcus equinus]|nr:hypothetical protein SAMN05216346_101585 [Streptococcus equinus]SFR66888.1 hypothetical protein SAMN05216416_0739 [Streptococcus equinus]